MPIIRVIICHDGKTASNIHLGKMEDGEAERIGKEIMDICYRKQHEADFNKTLATRIANDESTSPEVLRKWLKAALEAMG